MSQNKDYTYLNKRNSLQDFVKEQLIGPGAFNRKYYLLSAWDRHEFKGRLIANCQGIENASELITEVPAYQYSSAILFPQVELQNEQVQQEPEQPITDGEEKEEVAPVGGQDEFQTEPSESTSSKNQNYPNTFGLSIAVAPQSNISNDLCIEIRFRTYERIAQNRLSQLMLAHWVQFDPQETCKLVNEYLSEVFRIIEHEGNFFILANEQVDLHDHLYTIDYIYLERIRAQVLIPLIRKIDKEEKFFKYTSGQYGGVEYHYHQISEDALLGTLQKKLSDGHQDAEQMLSLLEALERYNQLKGITTELKTIYRKPSFKNRPTPVWSSRSHVVNMRLLEPETRKGTIRDKIEVEGNPGLFLNYQYLFHKDGLLYIKLILANRNQLFLGPQDPPQLNKRDNANELSFFGVELKVSEQILGTLKPYNPPNLISVDDEDNFNKILYRDFKDYGEGYNTSVAWTTPADGELRQVRTAFLPHEDTPDIDFEPVKFQGTDLIPLTDKKVLSMRSLSSLSDLSNEETRKALDEFADAYGIWVEGQREEIIKEELSASSKQILQNQIKGCEMDFKRLKRNISLLFENTKALAAFRVMNTAMYMQLVHGRAIKGLSKKNEKSFTPAQNAATYYKNYTEDYSWRSFQLAFILLNLDAFLKPGPGDDTIPDVFGTGWPERNEIADLVWFPTGGGKTEAYLGIIAFCIAFRRFELPSKMSGGTVVLMRYTLRLLTLQQFQRATLLICALEAMRKDFYPLPNGLSLGNERITIGLFVGGGSLPNSWEDMDKELKKIALQFQQNPELERPNTKFPNTECPWCGAALFTKKTLPNLSHRSGETYKLTHTFSIMCNTPQCTFHGVWASEEKSLPLRIFDEDIYKYPPTLLFGTVDKFAALANNVDTHPSGRAKDAQRFFGKGNGQTNLPPELIIQDELHLLLGPLGSAVGLFEKAIDECCTLRSADGSMRRPKIITSTATTRNTDKQIFALFNRRAEIFPKQGIRASDSFFACYKRDPENPKQISSKRRYMGILPVGKTQVWIQLRLAAIALAHRVKYMREELGTRAVLTGQQSYILQEKAMDYYHTVLSYFNSLKEVGKTQSQLTHYLPTDLDLVLGNTIGWTILGKLIRPSRDIQDSELTGRLSGEDVKGSLAKIQREWKCYGNTQPPEFVISTNMISVGIDVSRFNTMIINSMPRNIAEYIQASSRVARDKEGIVFTVHHPFRSRDLSHYQRFREFHEKFYSYVEPISVTPFASKALERYFAMFLAVMVRHDKGLLIQNNKDAGQLSKVAVEQITDDVMAYITEIHSNATKLNAFLKSRTYGIPVNVSGILDSREMEEIQSKIKELLITRWLDRLEGQEFHYRNENESISLFSLEGIRSPYQHWNVKNSLREIAPSVVIKTVQQ